MVRKGEPLVKRPFTPDEDAYLIRHYSKATFGAMARKLDRAYPPVQQRINRLIGSGRLKREDRCYHRPWTETEDEYLAANWGILPDDHIAAHLDRTGHACLLRCRRHLKVKRKDNIYTMRQVARIFGVDDKTPLTWAQRGWVKCTRAGYCAGNGRVWNFDHDSIEAFVTRMPWAYDWRRMGDEGYFTELAKRVNLTDPWLTRNEVCKELGRSLTWFRRWYKQGLLPFKIRPKQQASGDPSGLIVVRKADLPGFLDRVKAEAHKHRSEGRMKRHAARKQVAA